VSVYYNEFDKKATEFIKMFLKEIKESEEV